MDPTHWDDAPDPMARFDAAGALAWTNAAWRAARPGVRAADAASIEARGGRGMCFGWDTSVHRLPDGGLGIVARWPSPDDLHRRVLTQLPDDAIVVFDHDLVPALRGGRLREGAEAGPGGRPAHDVAHYIGDEAALRVEAAQRAVLAGHSVDVEVELRGRPQRLIGQPIRDVRGAITHGLFVVRDITDQRAAADELAEQLALHDAILRVFPNGAIFVVDQDYRYRMAGGAALGPTGYPAESILGKTAQEVLPPEAFARLKPVYDGALAGRDIIFHHESPTGRHYMVYGVPIQRGPDGGVNRALLMTQDVTDVEQANAQLRTALDEKSVLLEEVHHRVKNNLQVVSSLLRMQGRRVADPVAREALDVCRRRVLVMAGIHEELYATPDLAELRLSDTLQRIAEGVVRTHSQPGLAVSLETSLAEEVVLRLDQVLPVGLIVHELLTNAMQHAWPHGGEGCVRVGLREDSDETLVIDVEDDGVGQGEPSASDGLGRRLVAALARQAGGTLSYAVEGGTRWTLRLTRPPAS